MNVNFTKYFTPFQKLVIDESLVLFRGRLLFRQYIKSKAHRFGIKLFDTFSEKYSHFISCSPKN